MGSPEPRGQSEWSRRAIINVVSVLSAHAESLTLIGAHAVFLRTADLDVPLALTGDGDLAITPALVSTGPSIEALLVDAGYEHRTTARPGLWGRGPYLDRLGNKQFLEKVDLLAPHGLIGAASPHRRGVPALQAHHGKWSVGNERGLELATFDRSLITITDLVDSGLSAQIYVAGIPALLLAKSAKIGERSSEPRRGEVRDKDVGDLWRLMQVADPEHVAETIGTYLDHTEAGPGVRQAVAWARSVIGDPVSRERAKRSLDGFVDPAEIDRAFAQWRDVLPAVGTP